MGWSCVRGRQPSFFKVSRKPACKRRCAWCLRRWRQRCAAARPIWQSCSRAGACVASAICCSGRHSPSRHLPRSRRPRSTCRRCQLWQRVHRRARRRTHTSPGRHGRCYTPQEPDQATPASLPSDGSWEPPSPHPAPPGTPGRRSRLGGSLAEPVTSPTPPVPPWADGSSSPFAGRLSTGSLERMSPRLRSLPEQRRRATDSDETLMQQHRQRSLMRRSSAGGGGVTCGGLRSSRS